jgi:hypothetical protein
MIATVGGAAGVFGGSDGGPNRSTIEFRPGSEENTTSAKAKTKSTTDTASFTTEAVKEKDGRITLSGRAGGVKPGSRLTVQRKDGSGWSDFPADTTVDDDGTYSLWIKTSRSGSYRVKDEKSGAASKPVSVKV